MVSQHRLKGGEGGDSCLAAAPASATNHSLISFFPTNPALISFSFLFLFPKTKIFYCQDCSGVFSTRGRTGQKKSGSGRVGLTKVGLGLALGP